MSETSTSIDLDFCISAIQQAQTDGSITASAVRNMKIWLTESRYSAYAAGIEEHIKAGKWQKLDDVFWTVIPFGTGGRRGMMYPFGSNAINDRTIGESAQGLATYVKEVKPDGPWSMSIAYDTRHRSREFAELCASIMVANGFEIYFLDDYRSTPELSYLTRYHQCDCGIMVTASHNPPSDNAVKVYWSTGGQLIPPHDAAVIDRVDHVDEIPLADFAESVQAGKIHFVKQKIDEALKVEQLKHSFAGPRNLNVIFSPLHGVGEFNVQPLLHAAGFENLEIYEPHREPNGDFPNVPGHVSNPENKQVFTAIIEHARQTGGELILATDPDCDRMGAAAPLTTDPAGEWATFNGNQLAVLLADYVLRKRQSQGSLTPDHYLVTTLVSTDMISQLAKSYGVKCFADNLVGFKWIASVMDREGASKFLYGAEESHGYLVGEYCRDKDGAIACLMMSELAALIKSEGKSLFEHLDELYRKHGYYQEHLINVKMAGSDGMKRMESLLSQLRTDPPKTVGGLAVTGVRDYSVGKRLLATGGTEPIDGPTGNVLVLETEQAGNYIAVRPSGTEPKIKFYLFSSLPADQIKDLAETKSAMNTRIQKFATDMEAYCG